MCIDFLAGCIGGCAGVLVGHPLDTVKVHLQTQNPSNPIYTGTWHCLKTIVAKDNVRGLYRGITSPMAGIGAVNAIVFGIYGNVQRKMENPDALKTHFVAGSIAGFVQSIVCAPMELAKTRMQLQSDSSVGGIKHKGPLDCLKHIWRTEGMRGTFKGLGITAMRDVPGFSSYFVSYEWMMSLPASPNALHSLLAGGFAGIASWLACYPIDVIKTCLQADGMTEAPKFTGMLDVARKGYHSEGYQFFFRGINSTLLRAFPMNAACFFVVSIIMRMSKSANLDITMQSSEPIAMVNAGTTAKTLAHIHDNEHWPQEVERRRKFMVKTLQALGAFHEAVCHSEVEDLAREFFPDHEHHHDRDDQHLYYIHEYEELHKKVKKNLEPPPNLPNC